MATNQLAVSTASVDVLDQNDERTVVAFSNTDSNEICYIDPDVDAATNKAFPVYPRQTIILSIYEGFDVTKKIKAIASGAMTLAVWEDFKHPPGTNGVIKKRGC